MSAPGSTSLRATGNIYPSRFVKLDTSADSSVAQCGNDGKAFGISAEFKKGAPITNAVAYAAESGDDLAVYTEGEICLLEYGGTVTRGDYLRSDANGKGVAIDTLYNHPQIIGAEALQSGSTGTLGRVKIVRMIAQPNSSYL